MPADPSPSLVPLEATPAFFETGDFIVRGKLSFGLGCFSTLSGSVGKFSYFVLFRSEFITFVSECPILDFSMSSLAIFLIPDVVTAY